MSIELSVEQNTGKGNSVEESSNRRLASQCADLVRKFNFCFFGNEPALQAPLVTVAPMRVEQLAAHHRVQTSLDVPIEITVNARWISRPLWEVAEVLAHELIHVDQEYVLMKPIRLHSQRYYHYHDQQFIGISQELGLHIRYGVNGYHEKPADGQFARLMELLNIRPPEYTADDLTLTPETPLRHWWDYDRGIQEGQSSLLKYICACPDGENSIRSGRKDKDITCNVCGQPFHLDHSHRRRGKVPHRGKVPTEGNDNQGIASYQEPSMGIDEETGRIVDTVTPLFRYGQT